LEAAEHPDREPDDPILEADFTPLTDAHRQALGNAADSFNDLIFARRDKFEPVFRYLQRRGLNEEIIKRFNIGFCPALEDKEFRGRALLKEHFDEFMRDPLLFNLYRKAGLFKLLNDETIPGYQYYRQHIDHSNKNPYGVYADFFINRFTFPIYDANGQIEGMIGRRLDNRGIRWLKQTGEGTFIRPKAWLYGIDKSARGMKEYQVAIVVEGIFDFFAFYNISENKDKPIVISTLGTDIQLGSVRLLRDFGVEHMIAAFDMDPAGRRGIQKAVTAIKGISISFLGSLKEGEDPADRLKGVLSKASDFAIRHLQKGMQVKHPTGKPIGASILVQRTSGKKVTVDHILLKPAATLSDTPAATSLQEHEPKDLWYRINSIVHLLSYNHRNRVDLKKRLQQVIFALSDPQKDPPPDKERKDYFRLPNKFIEDEHHLKLGDALILHLRLAIEQQTKKRKGGVGGKITGSDSTIAAWLGTSIRTIQKYKSQLKEAGLLNVEAKGRAQQLSVKYFRKPERIPTPTRVS
jgi:DNA primase